MPGWVRPRAAAADRVAVTGNSSGVGVGLLIMAGVGVPEDVGVDPGMDVGVPVGVGVRTRAGVAVSGGMDIGVGED